jgi:hypothetical protein
MHADAAAGATVEAAAADSQAVSGVDGAPDDIEDANVDEPLQEEAEEEDNFTAFEEEEECDDPVEEEAIAEDDQMLDAEEGEEGGADEQQEDWQCDGDGCDGGHDDEGAYGGEENCCGFGEEW